MIRSESFMLAGLLITALLGASVMAFVLTVFGAMTVFGMLDG